MPADHLNPGTPVAARANELTDGVLAVLSGASPNHVATELGMTTADLADAAETYRRAGHVALETQAAARNWYQVHVQFPHWATAEHTAVTEISPRLRPLQESGLLAAWWFIRKAPCWRLRLKPARELADLAGATATMLDGLTADGLISSWRHTIYEPEIAAFGSPTAMDIAHDLFCADTDNILAYLAQPEPVIGRRELSVLLCTTLFRAAGQEWFECGDIWHRITQIRPHSPGIPADRLTTLTASLHYLLSQDTRPTGALFGADGPLAFAAPWATAFHRAGQALATTATEGTLQQGIRDILRYHVIFHWNRIGLPTTTQTLLAHAAKAAIFK